MSTPFKAEKFGFLPVSFVVGLFVGVLFFIVGELAAFAFLANVYAGGLVALHFAATEAGVDNILSFASSSVKGANELMGGMAFGSLMLGLAVWAMEAVDERLKWTRAQPRKTYALRARHGATSKFGRGA